MARVNLRPALEPFVHQSFVCPIQHCINAQRQAALLDQFAEGLNHDGGHSGLVHDDSGEDRRPFEAQRASGVEQFGCFAVAPNPQSLATLDRDGLCFRLLCILDFAAAECEHESTG